MGTREMLSRDTGPPPVSRSGEDEHWPASDQDRHAEDPVFWEDFWRIIDVGSITSAQTAQFLHELCEAPPQASVLQACLQSLGAFEPSETEPMLGAVNVVGTGGGPSTFNITTASAFVAAEMGARVIKTGSRAYKSRRGSVDMLEQLGIRMSASHSDIAQSVERFGLAFAGPHVYPEQLRQLARHLYPTDLKRFGNFLNAIGPFIARVPVRAQVTGVSDQRLVAELQSFLHAFTHRRVWLLHNELDIDELVSGVDNEVLVGPSSDANIRVPAGELRWNGEFAEALESRATSGAVAHFQSVLAGEATEAETQTVALNAAVAALAAECETSLEEARDHALRVLESGAALVRLNEMRHVTECSS